MLDRLAALPIPGDEAPRGTVVDLSQESRPQPGVVSTLDLVPHLSVRIAEARARTQRLRVRERQGGSFQDLRSEEHTSELQSQSNLVCRLLLEKKKITNPSDIHTSS